MLSETLGRNLSCFFLAFGDGRQSLDFSCITLGSAPVIAWRCPCGSLSSYEDTRHVGLRAHPTPG